MVIVGQGGIRGLNDNAKITIKIFFKILENCVYLQEQHKGKALSMTHACLELF